MSAIEFEPLEVGSVSIPNRVVLAPMSGVSDLPFRRLAARYGVGLVVSEMVASREMLRESRQSARRMLFDAGTRPVSIQLAGTEPDVMADAARLAVDRGAEIVDINFGCPAKKVVRKATGSALMRDVPLATAIMEAVVGAVSVPVSVKMRTGWDRESRNGVELARIAEDVGVGMLTVHGRTRCDFYTGTADWDFIAGVKDAVKIPLIANGDIRNHRDAVACLQTTGADAIMIGRAAQGKPWLPGDVAHFLKTGRVRPEPGIRERWGIMRDHLEDMMTLYGANTGIRNARKHIGWYLTGVPGAAEFRNVVNNTLDPAVIARELARFREHTISVSR